MSMRKFTAYIVLAFWIGVTAVGAGTANGWFNQEAKAKARLQIGLDVSKEIVHYDAEYRDFRLASERALSLKRRFQWELGIWVVTTLLGSAIWAKWPERSKSNTTMAE
jgi:hypothetical protein